MNDVITLGRLSFLPNSKLVYWDSKKVKLSWGRSAIVEILARSPGTSFHQRDLYKLLRDRGLGHKGERAGYVVMRSAIRHIRRCFRNIDPAFDAIKTARCGGYYWHCPEAKPCSADSVDLQKAA